MIQSVFLAIYLQSQSHCIISPKDIRPNNIEMIYMEKRYRVDFYDMFDGWIYRDIEKSENDFHTLEEAMAVRDKKNSELPESNKKCDEHFGVIDLVTREEICCPMKIMIG